MGLPEEEARRVAAEVLAVCSRWKAFMKEGDVPDSDIAILERCFAYQTVVQDYLNSKRRSDRPKGARA